MSKIYKTTVSIELELGVEFELDVEATVEYDPSYGADADGNRGVGCWFIKDAKYELPKWLSRDFDITDQINDEILRELLNI